MGVFSFLKKNKTTGIQVAESLESLGYFTFSDSGNIAALKTEIAQNFDQYNVLTTLSDNRNFTPLDGRLYFCDGEELFEIGGLESYLQFAKHAFELRGLQLNWTNEISEEDGVYWDHRITINGKEYDAFVGDMTHSGVWGTAQLNYYRILNDQLSLQGSDEQVYPISAGEEGMIVFLNAEQFNFISTHFYQGNKFRPWEVIQSLDQWQLIHKLT